jgi:hypothetical protein
MKNLLQALLVMSLAGCTHSAEQPAADALAGLNAPDLKRVEFTISQSERRVKEAKITVFSASSGADEIQVTRIENLAPGAAEQMLEQKKYQVEGLYQEEKSPYPGFLSKAVKCAPEFLPDIEFNKGVSLRVRAAANGRRSLGVCDAAEMQFAAVVLYYYCARTKVLLQIEGYLPKTETGKAKDFLKKVSC